MVGSFVYDAHFDFSTSGSEVERPENIVLCVIGVARGRGEQYLQDAKNTFLTKNALYFSALNPAEEAHGL